MVLLGWTSSDNFGTTQDESRVTLGCERNTENSVGVNDVRVFSVVINLYPDRVLIHSN